MTYAVETPAFQGPFDLLLHLILRDEVDLYEVSLLEIVDQFVAHLDRLGDLDLETATEFLLIAATLVELKSRRLLPDTADGDLDDELALWEERDLLLARLLECKTFKDVAVRLENMARVAELSYPRTAGLEEQFIGLMPDLLEGVTAHDLQEAFRRAVTPRPTPHVSTEHIAPIGLSVADAVEELLDELPRTGTTTFRELTGSLIERLEIVVRFLAVLELYKQDLVELDQLTTFGSITITWIGGTEPHSTHLDTIDVYEG